MKIRNLARRPVSIPCNSGEYRHIPSSGSLELPEIEVQGNALIDKLIKRRVLVLDEDHKAESKKGTASKSSKSTKSTISTNKS